MALVTKTKRHASPAGNGRRHGKHHKRDPHYAKAYWPYLPMAFIVVLGVLAHTFWGGIQQHVLSYATNMSISSLLQETNEERAGGQLGGLSLNAQLNQAAQAKADDMAARNYWSHNTPEGSPPWTFVSNAGYKYSTAGENLAYGFDSSTDTVAGWMASPGHKANIMNGGYKEVGFGIANSADYQGTGPETIVVALYASPAAVAAAPPKPTPTPVAPAPVKTAPAPVVENPAPPVPAPVAEPNTTLTPTESQPQPAAVASKDVSRIQLLSGQNATWSMFVVSAIAAISAIIFFLRHGLLWHRVLVKSEAFIHKHPFLDIALVAVATVGIILTRTDGIIR